MSKNRNCFVTRKIDTVAVLRCLGATSGQVLAIYVLQAAAMGFLGAAFGVVLGIAIAPLPGPGGIPVIVVGLMIMLRNSFAARRQFVRFQRAHPKLIFPIRRLLRREPEVLQVAWQQTLRMERLVLPSKWRVGVRLRRSLKRGAAKRAAAKAAA